MKTFTKFFKPAATALLAVALLTACKSMPLEEQILEGMNEAGTYTFSGKTTDGYTGYIRIFDQPGKVGWFKFEYGQKHPCNQGFQKVIKTTAPGIVAYEHDHDAKSFACNDRLRYIFRADANGRPYEGWVEARKRNDARKFMDLTASVAFADKIGEKPRYVLVK